MFQSGTPMAGGLAGLPEASLLNDMTSIACSLGQGYSSHVQGTFSTWNVITASYALKRKEGT